MADVQVGALPAGTARLVELARALSIGPRVILLDEPCSGLDDNETESLGTLLTDLAAEGRADRLVEHDMDLVLKICDVVHVLDFGEVIASGSPRDPGRPDRPGRLPRADGRAGRRRGETARRRWPPAFRRTGRGRRPGNGGEP